jgi:outer membrane protein TolC
MLLFAVLLLALPASAQPEVVTESVTLQQCYEWAKLKSEDLKIRREDIAQSDARARAALGTALPRVEWELNDTFQDPAGVRRLERQGFGGFVQKEQVESKFTLTQTLFSGFKERAATTGFRKESARDALLLERAEKRLYERTAAAFYDVLLNETEQGSTQASLTSARDRVKELKGFLKLGKARDSEVFSAHSQQMALQAALRRSEARAGGARDELSRLTGRDLSAAPLIDALASPVPLLPLEEALDAARGRADLRARREDAAAKERRVRFESASYWPSLDLTGSYYTRRATFLSAIDWDLKLTAKVPLFQGGAVSARVKGARAAQRQAELALLELESEVITAVRSLHRELAAAVDEAAALADAARSAQDGYDALMKEYKLGLVTNLEVLTALDLLQLRRRERDSSLYRTKRLFVQLGVAVEKLR